MPKISYTVKGELFECEREKLSECVDALIKADRLPAGTDIGKVVSTGCQKIDYQKNCAPNTASNKKRREEKKDKPEKQATKI